MAYLRLLRVEYKVLGGFKQRLGDRCAHEMVRGL